MEVEPRMTEETAGSVLTDDVAMDLALEEAEKAPHHGDVPVGAVIIRNGIVLAQRHNERELTGDPSAHAEILALRDAASASGSWRLDGAVMVVTLEPCLMCAGGLLNARISRLVFATPDPKGGAAGSLYNVLVDPRLNHEVAVSWGPGASRAASLLTGFFAQRRTG